MRIWQYNISIHFTPSSQRAPAHGASAAPRRKCSVIDNLFSHLPDTPPAQEQFQTLLQQPGLCIERIVSFGHASPPDFWYQQPQAEWVLLLSGSASLRFADETQARQLRPGDFVQIAAQRRHRVDATASDQASVWLAIHYPADNNGEPQ